VSYLAALFLAIVDLNFTALAIAYRYDKHIATIAFDAAIAF
jgi:hypothetical protein